MPSSIFRPDLLSGKVALISGGGTGIGASAARELGGLGARVVIASRKESNVRPAAESLSAELGAPVAWRVLDIRDRDGTNNVAKQLVEEFGAIDILVNNGGGQFLAPAETISPRGFDAVVSTNLTGTWNLTRAVADAWMLAHGGRIINITMLTQRGFPGMAHSVSARAGVEALTRNLSIEWAAAGIRVNAIAPGYVSSSGLRHYPPELGVLEHLQSRVPLKRLARREEIAWMIAYLASPAADYITGQTLTIAGGSDLWGDLWPIPDPDNMSPVVPEVDPWESAE